MLFIWKGDSTIETTNFTKLFFYLKKENIYNIFLHHYNNNKMLRFFFKLGN